MVEKYIMQRGLMSFRVRLTSGGRVINKTFDTLDAARVFRDLSLAHAAIDPDEAATFEARAKRAENKNYTFADAINDYRKISEQKKGAAQEKSKLDKLARSPAAALPLYQIRGADIVVLLEWIKTSGKIVKAKNAETGFILKPTVTSESTQKRYFNLIRHIFEIAVTEWQKIEANPCAAVPKSKRPKDGQPRNRRLKGDEYAQLLARLTGEYKVIFVLAVETAMRRGEIFSMTWENLDLAKHTIYIPATKIDEARTVYLSDTAIAAIKELPRGIKGAIIKCKKHQFNHAWERERDAIGSHDLRLHDMRHEATSRLFEKGATDILAMTVTGHKTPAMLARYAHLKQDQILEVLNKPSRA